MTGPPTAGVSLTLGASAPRVLVLGGSRSGKSGLAERIVARRSPEVVYLATGPGGDGDPDWANRVERHRRRRPSGWTTVECGADLAGALGRHPHGVALVDALGTWVAAHDDLAVDLPGLLAALVARPGDTVLVSDEVGLGVHPETALGRRFRDVLGDVNAAVAEVCDEVLLVVAGRVLALPRWSPGGDGDAGRDAGTDPEP